MLQHGKRKKMLFLKGTKMFLLWYEEMIETWWPKICVCMYLHVGEKIIKKEKWEDLFCKVTLHLYIVLYFYVTLLVPESFKHFGWFASDSHLVHHWSLATFMMNSENLLNTYNIKFLWEVTSSVEKFISLL